MYAVVVTFKLKAGASKAFVPLVRENARQSIAEEPDCHRFDVCTDPARPNEVMLYEVYSHRDAFKAHLESSHFRAFDRQSCELVLGKDVRTYAEVAS